MKRCLAPLFWNLFFWNLLLALPLLGAASSDLGALLANIQGFSKADSLRALGALSSPFGTPRVAEPLRLQAIINHKAMINGVWLSPGQGIQGFVLLSIGAQSVVLEKHGARLILKLGAQEGE